MAGSRKESVYMAKLAEQAERYDEMVDFMEKVTAAATAEGDELTAEERDLLSEAFRKSIGARRASWRLVSAFEDKEENCGNENHDALIRDYRAKIESELSSICDRVLRLLEDHLFPSVSTAEPRVFYLKMKGDYHRYLAEFKMATDLEEAAESTLAAYTAAQNIAVTELAPVHPTRLGLALNHSVFCSEILNSPEQACNIAKQAFDDARAAIDASGEEFDKKSTLIMQFLRGNLKLWNSDMQDDDIDEIKTKDQEDK